MIQLIVGTKGSGKTKRLIELVNAALEATDGSVVCVEKGNKLIHEIKYQARLIDTEEYAVGDAETLYGFIAGIAASNHDVTNLFIDSALKICNNDLAAFTEFVKKTEKLASAQNISVVITSSIEVENVPAEICKYVG